LDLKNTIKVIIARRGPARFGSVNQGKITLPCTFPFLEVFLILGSRRRRIFPYILQTLVLFLRRDIIRKKDFYRILLKFYKTENSDR